MFLFVAGMSLIVYLTACGVGGADLSDESSIDTAYVDANIGDDVLGDGTQENPYKTLTRALGERFPAGHIEVSPGLYNADSGEIFPLFVPMGIQIKGGAPVDIENSLFTRVSGTGALESELIAGENQVGVVLGPGASVQDMVIESEGGVAVWSENGDEVLDCVIRNSKVGIAVIGHSALCIFSTSIYDNTGAGIEIHDFAKPILVRNLITSNSTGILVLDSAEPYLGSNNLSIGLNVIKNNTLCDLHNLGSSDLTAVGNKWDDEPFSFIIETVCSDGANIVNEGRGGVSYQYVPPTNTPVFPGTSRIPLGSPSTGELLITDRPDFNWTSTGAREAILFVWARPPNLDSTGAIDENGIVWAWHTGLGTGFPGAVSFQDGRSTPTGKMNELTDPVALNRGTAYYWAVWEWDEDGMSIIASSDLGYFRVSN
jgi:parallel beta-helix repeat protein